MTHLSDTLDSIRDRSAFGLSADADVAGPDTLDSPGSQFLTRARDAVLDYWDGLMGPATDPRDALRAWEHEGADGQIADDAVPIYNHERMLTLVDLAAYHEDPSEIGQTDGRDLLDLAGWCLYIVASRLVGTLIAEIDEAIGEDEAEADETAEV